ncbi:MAG: oligosaccharide flippase family protein, partial [Planctomycetales bacterium]|nr:oligosaccharide flippase family protein [Planctomycetales bacterium]
MNKKDLLSHASRGVVWTLGSSISVLALSLLTQVVLGWYLDERDFGVYAFAIAYADVVRVFRGSGLTSWLSRLTSEEFSEASGEAFWLSLGLSLLTAAVLLVVAWPIGWVYREPQVPRLLAIIAISIPLSAYAPLGLAKLQVDLKFKQISAVKFASAVVRYGLVILCSYWGWGAYSLAVPMVLVSLFQTVIFIGLTRIYPWRKAPQLRLMRQLFGLSKWSSAGALATAVLRQIDYAVYGLFAPTAIVGIYFFAYQLTMQPVLLFSESLRSVVLPVFHRVAGQEGSQRRGLELSATFLGMVAGPAMILLSVLMPDLEACLWNGRWQAAVPCIQILAVVMPWQLTAFFVEMLVQSRGHFGLWTSVIFFRGLGFGIAAGIGAQLGGQSRPEIVALCIAVYIVVASLVEVLFLFRAIELPWSTFFARLIPPYLLAAIAGLLAAGALKQGWVGSALSLRLVGAVLGYSAVLLAAYLLLLRAAFRDLWT